MVCALLHCTAAANVLSPHSETVFSGSRPELWYDVKSRLRPPAVGVAVRGRALAIGTYLAIHTIFFWRRCNQRH